MSLMIVVGTRPEIIKMAPVIIEARNRDLDFDLVHTDQHYDQNLSGSFFDQLELPSPDYHLNVKSGSQAEQTARILLSLEPVIDERGPDVVLAQGDTNTVLGTGITAVKLGTDIGHVEAGLRSRDLRMPEEHNRRIVDHISQYLFAPTQKSAANLQNENVWGQIEVTGNTVIDALDLFIERALDQSSFLDQVPFNHYALVTIHRAENVDDPETLRKVVEILEDIIEIPVLFPIHPRTVSRLQSMNLYDRVSENDRIMLTNPIPYFDFLTAMQGSDFIVTDSGGVQEEATHPKIRKPVIVTRLSTERPEAIAAGFAVVVGFHLDEISRAISEIDAEGLPHKSPFGNGDASKKILNVIQNRLS